MNSILLSTKFNIPVPSAQLVERAHLLSLMDAGLRQDCLLTLVSAPAGYGKTTLVSEWIEHVKNMRPGEDVRFSERGYPKRFAWLTLDQSDNDLGVFIAYFIAALQQIDPEVGEGITETLRTPKAPDPKTLATWLINDLTKLPDRFVLVLDDFHLISAQSIHDFLSFLIDHQPAQICILIATRADPPFPLARMRARGQLTELRQDELRFSLPEVESFLRNAVGINLTAEQCAAFEERTEGWVAGLQLAALSMRNIEDVPTFISAFSGGNIHIADFLIDEVLNQQPDPIKKFLLQTAVLERLSAPLCEAVSGYSKAQETLGQLVDENMFLIPLDQQGEWYRYHSLFADMLRKRLYQSYGDLVDELHLRASQWYGDSEMLAPAVEHALAGKGYQQAAEIIVRLGEDLMKRGEVNTLLRWLEALPKDFRLTHPILIVYYGLVLMFCGKPPQAAKAELMGLVNSAKLEDSRGEVETFQGLMSLMQGNAVEAIQQSERALQYLAPEKTFFRCLAADSLGMAYTLQSDTAAASQAFQEVVHLSEQSGNIMMALGALSNLAGLLVLQGKLNAAANAYQRVIKIGTERLGMRSQLTGKAYLGLGLLAREWDDLESALRYYEDAAEMFESSIEIGLPVVFLSMAMVKLNQRDEEACQAYIDLAHQYSMASTSTSLDDKLTEEMQVRFWIAQGKLNQAEDWLRSKGYFEPTFVAALNQDDGRVVSQVLALQNTYLNLSRLNLAKNQPERSLEILEPLFEIFNKRGYVRRCIEVLALKALALRKQENIRTALLTLDQALSLAKPEGFRRTFLDEGEPMARLLYLAAAEGMHVTYIGGLLAAFAQQGGEISNQEQAKGLDENLIEPLSQRELEVLNLLAEGLSNQEIGLKLHISLSTVKGHTTQIYGKLNVNNRTQAVARARLLGVLPFI